MKKSILLGAAAIAGTLVIGVATGFAADPAPPPGPGPMGGPPPQGFHGRHGMLGGDFLGPLAQDMRKNGKVTKAEVENALKKRFNEADANHDGKLSPAEIQAWREAQRAKRREAAFKRLDTNGDGGLSQSELDARVLAHFDRLDTNHDGVVSKEEMQAAHAKWRGKFKDWRGHGMRGNGPPPQQ
jgi:Ca2+-binding EF-hand superfamily protein